MLKNKQKQKTTKEKQIGRECKLVSTTLTTELDSAI